MMNDRNSIGLSEVSSPSPKSSSSSEKEELYKSQTKARRAYTAGDKEESIRLHNLNEKRGDQGCLGKFADYIKSIVFGGLDGTITTFAVVAGVAGAGLATTVILILGFANLVADGLSMGMGDFLSERAEQEYINKERKREVWEFENYPEGEEREMVEIYKDRGMVEKDAEKIISIMSKYKEIFVDTMMYEELGLQPVDPDDSPAKKGLATFVSFMFFGLMPLIAYLVANSVSGSSTAGVDITFVIACIITAVTLFVLGALASVFSSQKWYIGGLFTLANGGLTAAAAFAVGYLLNLIVEDTCNELEEKIETIEKCFNVTINPIVNATIF